MDITHSILYEEIAMLDKPYSPNNNRDTAAMLLHNQVHQHTLSKMGEEDWFKIQAIAGETYTISTFDLGFAADTYV
jgi:hypothetical protein